MSGPIPWLPLLCASAGSLVLSAPQPPVDLDTQPRGTFDDTMSMGFAPSQQTLPDGYYYDLVYDVTEEPMTTKSTTTTADSAAGFWPVGLLDVLWSQAAAWPERPKQPEAPAKPMPDRALLGIDPNGCTGLDHDACDEICKLDNFWYGHCGRWDGKNFACNCFRYKRSLDADLCDEARHKACARECREKDSSNYGGYCYPHPTKTEKRGVARCNCFVLEPSR